MLRHIRTTEKSSWIDRKIQEAQGQSMVEFAGYLEDDEAKYNGVVISKIVAITIHPTTEAEQSHTWLTVDWIVETEATGDGE